MATMRSAAFAADFSRAERLRSVGLWNEAVEHYRLALLERLGATRQPWRTTELMVIDRFAEAAVLVGKNDAALAALAAMESAAEENGDAYARDYARLKWALTAALCGSAREAHTRLDAFARSSAQAGFGGSTAAELADWEGGFTWPHTTPADRAILFVTLYLAYGVVLAHVGQYRSARLALQRGVFHAAGNGEEFGRRSLIALQLEHTQALLECGEVEAARSLLDKIRPVLDPTSEPGYYVRSLEAAAKLALLEGDFGTALEQLRRCRNVCQGSAFKKAALACSVRLSHVRILLNQTVEAEEELLIVRDEAVRLEDRELEERTEFLLELVQLRRGEARDLQAVSTISEMWGVPVERKTVRTDRRTVRQSQASEALGFLSLFEVRTLEWLVLLDSGDTDTAAKSLGELRATFGDTDSLLIQGRLSAIAGLLAFYGGQYLRAEGILTRAVPVFSRLGLKHDLWQIQRVLMMCRLHQGRPDARLAQRNSDLLRELAASLSPMDRIRFELNKWTEEEEYFTSMVRSIVELRKKKALLQRWQGGIKARRFMEEVEAYRRRLINAIGQAGSKSEVPEKPAFLRFLLRRQARQTCRISFLVLPDCVVTCVETGWRLEWIISPITRLQLRESVKYWHEVISGRKEIGPNGVRKAFEMAQSMASAMGLREVLERLPKSVRHVVFAPDDVLHGFPFAALQIHGQFLCEKVAVSIAVPVTSNGGRRNSKTTVAAVISAGRNLDGYPDLPGADSESEMVREWAAQQGYKVVRLSDQNANQVAVRELLGRSAIAHVTCHGVFRPTEPGNSGLVLSGPAETAVLRIRDLVEDEYACLEHITVASCWSAETFISAARWVVSLPEILAAKGTGSILGCFWEVDDEFAIAFFRRFYLYLMDYPRDSALARTQSDCIAGRMGERGKDPSYWAGFGIYGERNFLRRPRR